jgi:hypothetical protein
MIMKWDETTAGNKASRRGRTDCIYRATPEFPATDHGGEQTGFQNDQVDAAVRSAL